MNSSANPWDVAPARAKGDQTADELYRAVGIALSIWETVDETCAWIFAVLVDSRNGAAELAYGSVVASSARVEMIKAAGQRALHQDESLLKDLQKMLAVTTKLGARRNEIAHGIVQGYEVMTVDQPVIILEDDDRFGDEGFYLVPPRYATRKRGSPAASSPRQFYLQGTYAYVAEQVLDYANQFREDQLALRTLLTGRIMAHYRKHWRPREPEAR